METEGRDEGGFNKNPRVVSDLIVERLKEEVDVVFGVYGGAISNFWDALPRGNLPYVCPMHEQAAGFMAEGYAKIHGFGVAMVTSGPGALNVVTCIGNCFYDSVPVLFITGQVNTRFMKQDPALRQMGFQETEITEIVKPITKRAITVKSPAYVATVLDGLIKIAKDGRPGPVLLDLPTDVQSAKI